MPDWLKIIVIVVFGAVLGSFMGLINSINSTRSKKFNVALWTVIGAIIAIGVLISLYALAAATNTLN